MKRRLPPIYYYHTSCVCVCVCVFLKGRKDRADHEDQDAETGAMFRKSPPPTKKQETIQLQTAREDIWNANNGNPKHRRQHSRNLPG